MFTPADVQVLEVSLCLCEGTMALTNGPWSGLWQDDMRNVLKQYQILSHCAFM